MTPLAFCRHGFTPGSGLCRVCEPRPEAPEPAPIVLADFSAPGSRRHPKTIDLTGQTIAGAMVIRQAVSQGGARWLVRATCGHLVVALGVLLRAMRKQGKQIWCEDCRKRRHSRVVADLEED